MSHNLRGGFGLFTRLAGAQCSLGHCTLPSVQKAVPVLREPAPRAGQGGVPQAPTLTRPFRSGGAHLRENHTGQPEPPCLLWALNWNLNIAGVHGWGERNPSLRRSPQAPEWQRKSLNEGATGQLCGPCPSPSVPFFLLPTAVRERGPPEEGDEDPSDNQMLPALAPGNRRDSPGAPRVGEAQHSSTHTTCLCCRDFETRPQRHSSGGSGAPTAL